MTDSDNFNLWVTYKFKSDSDYNVNYRYGGNFGCVANFLIINIIIIKRNLFHVENEINWWNGLICRVFLSNWLVLCRNLFVPTMSVCLCSEVFNWLL